MDTKAPKILGHKSSDTDDARTFHQRLVSNYGISYSPPLSQNQFNYHRYREQENLIFELEQERRKILADIRIHRRLESIRKQITSQTARANVPTNYTGGDKEGRKLDSLLRKRKSLLERLPTKDIDQLKKDRRIVSGKILKQKLLKIEFTEYGCLIDPQALEGLDDSDRMAKLLEIFRKSDQTYSPTNRQYINRLKLLRRARIVSKSQYEKHYRYDEARAKVYVEYRKLEYNEGDYEDPKISKSKPMYYDYRIPLTGTFREWRNAYRKDHPQTNLGRYCRNKEGVETFQEEEVSIYGCELPNHEDLKPRDQFNTLIEAFSESDKKYRPHHGQVHERIELLENIRQDIRVAEYRSKKRKLIKESSPFAQWLTKLFGRPLKVRS